MLARIQEEAELQSLAPLHWPDRPAGIKCFLKWLPAYIAARQIPCLSFV